MQIWIFHVSVVSYTTCAADILAMQKMYLFMVSKTTSPSILMDESKFSGIHLIRSIKIQLKSVQHTHSHKKQEHFMLSCGKSLAFDNVLLNATMVFDYGHF